MKNKPGVSTSLGTIYSPNGLFTHTEFDTKKSHTSRSPFFTPLKISLLLCVCLHHSTSLVLTHYHYYYHGFMSSCLLFRFSHFSNLHCLLLKVCVLVILLNVFVFFFFADRTYQISLLSPSIYGICTLTM